MEFDGIDSEPVAGVLPLPEPPAEPAPADTAPPPVHATESDPGFELANPNAPLINFDENLQDGELVRGAITIVGFAQLPNSEGRVEIFIDGESIGDATYPSPRQDVPNSGFITDFDTGSLAEGEHVIEARSFDTSGNQIASDTVTVVVDRPERLGVIGTEEAGGSSFVVEGWAVDQNGFQRLEVLANGELLTVASPGSVARPEVAAAFSEASSPNVGFRALADAANLASGINTLTLVGVTNDGTRTELNETTYDNQVATGTEGFVETPAPGVSSSVADGVTVEGWVTGDAPVERVEVFLNDSLVAQTAITTDRDDIAAAIPAAAFVGGFSAEIPDLNLIPGEHEVRVIAVDADGDRTILRADGDGQREFTLREADRLLGAHLKPTNEFDQTIQTFAQDAGQVPEITMWFQAWQTGAGDRASFNQFPFLPEDTRSQGSIPMVTWESWRAGAGDDQPAFSLDNIAAGNFDSLIRSYAEEVRDFDSTVLIRFDHEFNIGGEDGATPWTGFKNGNDPQRYIDAWRHVVDIFDEVGAANAQWIWAPNFKSPPDLEAPANNFANYYPGDGYVDFVGVSGYNWGNDPINGSGWRTADSIYPTFMSQIGRLAPDKPLIVSEIGTFPDFNGNSAGQWIRDAFDLFDGFEHMKSVVWFNDFAFGDPNRADFRVGQADPDRPPVDQDRVTAFREAGTAWANENLRLGDS